MDAGAIMRRHILVVDDELLVAETVTLLLEWDGHLVDMASSGEEALSLFEPGKFDLVITDFFMPTMDGGEDPSPDSTCCVVDCVRRTVPLPDTWTACHRS